jgi:hypothetical protein
MWLMPHQRRGDMMLDFGTRCRKHIIHLLGASGILLLIVWSGVFADKNGKTRVYENSLTPIHNPGPILADYPQFVHPIQEVTRYEAPRLIDEPGADIEVRAWRFSYNARGIIEVPNRIRGDRTAIITVHPWSVDDEQGWITPEPAGVAFFCTPQKNRLSRKHAATVINPFLKSFRDSVSLVMYSLPGSEDSTRKIIYRSFKSSPSAEQRELGKKELVKKLKRFSYRGKPLPRKMTLSKEQATIDYFRQFPGLDAGAHFNNTGFWDLPVPVVQEIEVDLDDVLIYDGDGYPALKSFLKKQGIRHVLLAGYATDMCVCKTTAGYENLKKDFNVFLVGDATLATFPGNSTPAYATNAAISFASLNLFITQVSWIRPLEGSNVVQKTRKP